MTRGAANALHGLAFQGAWFACVTLAVQGAPWLGAAVCAAFVAATLATSPRPRAEALYVVQLTALGVACDSLLLTASGALDWTSPAPRVGDWCVPPWVVGLWAGFVTLGPRAFAWLQHRLLLAAALGAAAAPFTYLGAAKLGGAQVVWSTWEASAVVSLEYAVIMPVMAILSRPATATPPTPAEPRAS